MEAECDVVKSLPGLLSAVCMKHVCVCYTIKYLKKVAVCIVIWLVVCVT